MPSGDVRRELAAADRKQGEDTLAILELQFYMVGLPPEDSTNRQWAKDQLEKIRELIGEERFGVFAPAVMEELD